MQAGKSLVQLVFSVRRRVPAAPKVTASQTNVRRTCQKESFDVDRLDVDEFLDAVAPELAPVPRLLDAAKGQPRVGRDERIHKGGARVELPGDTLAATDISREHGRAETERAVIRDPDGVVFVLRTNDCRDWSKQLFVVCRHARLDVREN